MARHSIRKFISVVLFQCLVSWVCRHSSQAEDLITRRRHHHVYLFFPNGSTWNDNRKKCLNMSADLVSLETEDEWKFITNELQNMTNRFQDEWHVGLQRRGEVSSKAWFWLTGVRLNYDHWQPYQPSGDGRCVNIAREYLKSTGGFNDLACLGWYSPRGFICEMDTHRDRAKNGPVYTEKWINIGGYKIQNLTNHQKFPNRPDETYYVKSFHITNENVPDYGIRMRSYFLAPMTGNFTFNTACDDACMLFLSDGINPKNERRILYQDVAAGINDYKEKYKSEPQFLEEGKLYFMKILFKQGWGIELMDIAIELPNGVTEAPMSPDHLRRDVTSIDLPGKDCVKVGDPLYPDYKNCIDFTQKDKLDGVKMVLKELQSNIANTSNQSTPKILKNTMQTAARKITFLLDENVNTEKSEETSDEGLLVSREVENLGKMVAEKISNKDEPIVMEYPSIVMQIKKLNEDFVFPNNILEVPFPSNDEITIKRSKSDSVNYLVFSSLYKNLDDLIRENITTIDGSQEGKYFLNSRIISSSLVPRPAHMDRDAVRLRLDHKRYKTSKDQVMVCAFWKYNTSSENATGSWSTVGCRISRKESNENYTVCHCDHLTHFAVLMKVTVDDKDKPMSRSHIVALEAITYVGCSLSLIGEVLTIVTLTCLRLARTETNTIHLNLVTALGLAQIIFLSGIGATANRGVCKFVAIALHFFNLVAFCWMLVEGLWLYVMVVRVFDTGYNRIRRYVIAAWSIPAVIVVVTLVSSFDGYGTKNSCWLSVEKGTIWSFVVPVLVIVLVNAIILALVVREILKLYNPTPADETKLQSVRSGIKSATVLLPILGIAWVFGILAVNTETIVFQYLFAIFNSLQGFMIFIFHCVLNSEVRKAFRRKKQIWTDSHLFQCHSASPPPKYESEITSKETRSTSNGMEKRPPSSSSTSRIFLR
ncbi:adhesion G protein-coupled receptor L2-like [Actinia tenebrosa]|uniref:Adhesion G protein-coupled receptor L2-like n=1 Tax=Actinia tenebrosa TaxID=6105 RepID=A0A6P8IIA8_ACTTE|nr:adhesion G protein-coupled receptor L2-like [Actinia tenebrosa]